MRNQREKNEKKKESRVREGKECNRSSSSSENFHSVVDIDNTTLRICAAHSVKFNFNLTRRTMVRSKKRASQGVKIAFASSLVGIFVLLVAPNRKLFYYRERRTCWKIDKKRGLLALECHKLLLFSPFCSAVRC